MDTGKVKKLVWQKVKKHVELSCGELKMPHNIDVVMVTEFVIDALKEVMKADLIENGETRFFGFGKISTQVVEKAYFNQATRKVQNAIHLKGKIRFFRKFGTNLRDSIIKRLSEDAAAEGNQLFSQGNDTGC